MTDDQRGDMLSAYRNPWLSTPAMDAIADGGVRFRNAHAIAPQCVPSRFALLNGVYPSSVGVRGNSHAPDETLADPVIEQSIGHQLGAVGYDCAWAGKSHVHWLVSKYGLETYFGSGRDRTVDSFEAFLGDMASRPDPSKPWFFFLSLINPHDIEQLALHQYRLQDDNPNNDGTPELSQQLLDALENPPGVSDDDFFRLWAPRLPDNFAMTDVEPPSIAKLLKKHKEVGYVRDTWTEQEWRRYIWAYHRLCETVDAHIGNALGLLNSSQYGWNTAIVFVSDHGTFLGSHTLSGKQVPYREALDVPLIVKPSGAMCDGRDVYAPVNTGLDLLPTICGLAGVDVSATHQGYDLLATEPPPSRYRIAEYLWGFEAFDGRYRYWRNDAADAGVETLFDTLQDPGELVNLGSDPDYAAKRAELGAVIDAHVGIGQPDAGVDSGSDAGGDAGGVDASGDAATD